MTAAEAIGPRVLTANEHFKSLYRRYLRWSAVVALGVTVLLFLFSPPYVPDPYRPPKQFIPEIVHVEPPIVEPPPVDEPIAPPRIVVPAPDDEVFEELEIADTLLPVGENCYVSRDWLDWFEQQSPFEVSVSNPEPIYLAAPEYPEMARLAHLQGTVEVHVLVGKDGSVIEAKVARGVHPLLDRAALAAGLKCRFRPGLQRERPVEAWMSLPYRFNLY
jgi:TonB family protein